MTKWYAAVVGNEIVQTGETEDFLRGPGRVVYPATTLAKHIGGSDWWITSGLIHRKTEVPQNDKLTEHEAELRDWLIYLLIDTDYTGITSTHLGGIRFVDPTMHGSWVRLGGEGWAEKADLLLWAAQNPAAFALRAVGRDICESV